MRFILFLLTIIGLFSAAQTPPPDITSLANSAGVIAIGTVSSVSPDGTRALVNVSEYYKRGLPQLSLQVVTGCAADAPTDCAATQANLTTGQNVILFLAQIGAGWSTVEGRSGVYTINADRVIDPTGADIGALTDVKAQLVQLTGQAAGTAPDADPTPEVVPVADSPDYMPILYIAVILVGLVGLVAMAVLARRVGRG